MLIDSHCHLNMAKLNEDLDQVIKRAKSSGVEYMQTICTNIKEISEVIAISEKYENVFTSVGVHPNYVNEGILSCEELLNYKDKIIGFGETGLDYSYEPLDKKLQKKSFVNHIEACQRSNIPIIIHNRNSDDDMQDILKSEMVNANFKGLMHCFASSIELARIALDLGLYISFSGIITFKNAHALRDIVKFVPMDRILIETDSPFLAPDPMRGKQNEPAFVKFVAHKIADLKEITYQNVANITTFNFKSLFNILD